MNRILVSPPTPGIRNVLNLDHFLLSEIKDKLNSALFKPRGFPHYKHYVLFSFNSHFTWFLAYHIYSDMW